MIATETSITDTYATRLLARLYGTLAQARDPDVVAALTEARRLVQAELETSQDRRDTELAGLGEWAAVTILAATGTVPVLDPGRLVPASGQPSRPQVAGLARQRDWHFVGRRPEQRRWPADLTGTSLAGIVICGIGGTGKTTLAAKITTRIQDREPGRIPVSLTGPLTLETLLGAVITTIRELLIRGQGQDTAEVIRALDVAARTDLGWQDRLAVLRAHVLDHVPVLLLLDNFEDNLRPDGDAGYAVGDEVLAELLAAWVADPGRSRLLVTCRYRFALPAGAERFLSFRQLGALSRAETMKLAWSLPALDRLEEALWSRCGGWPAGIPGRWNTSTRCWPTASPLPGRHRPARRGGHPSAQRRRPQPVAGRPHRPGGRAGRDRGAGRGDVLLGELLGCLDRVPGAADLAAGSLGVPGTSRPQRGAVPGRAARPGRRDPP